VTEPLAPEMAAMQRLLSPEFFADPYPVYAAMRELSPVLLLPMGTWVSTGFDESYAILRNHDVFSSREIGGNQAREAGPGQLALISDDPPRHTRLRGLVNRAFTPRRVKELEPRISGVVGELMEGFSPGVDVDVMAGLAVPLPITIIAEALGIPASDRERFKRWSNALISGDGPSNGGNPERLAHLQEMQSYFIAEVADRRRVPAADLLSALTTAEIDGSRLEDYEVLGMATLLLVAGNETTTNLIGNMLAVLAVRPDLWAAARADRALVETIVEETLRYDSPVQNLGRKTLTECEVGGQKIPAGQEVIVSFAAGNRDPKAFEKPDEFRMDRDLRSHLAFGNGIHYCLGAPLARAEARIACNALLDRFGSVAPGTIPGVRQSSSLLVRGYTTLPLRFGL
jgi:cytochrome P450